MARYIDIATGQEKTFAHPIDVIEQLKAGVIREEGSKAEAPKVEAPKVEAPKAEEPVEAAAVEPATEEAQKRAPRHRPSA
ncbi:MAG TPA: hypothetical protein QF626_02500 [Prochlorococcaceae cyanobacterium Fu_MAG_50]|nr:hypothetical protein [Prochlorococcaceae cyanobacterium Fu_MAG_50]